MSADATAHRLYSTVTYPLRPGCSVPDCPAAPVALAYPEAYGKRIFVCPGHAATLKASNEFVVATTLG